MTKRESWKTVIQIVITLLTAIATSLGVSSCKSVKPKSCLPQVEVGKTKAYKPLLPIKRLFLTERVNDSTKNGVKEK